MPIQVLQPFVTTQIIASAIGFLLLTDFNAILVSAAILLSRIEFETARPRGIYPGQRDVIICVS